MKIIIITSIFGTIMMLCYPLYAHEVRPSLLQLTQVPDNSTDASNSLSFDIIWKQPVTGGKRLRLTPSFPEQCNSQSQASAQSSSKGYEIITSDAIVRLWRITCSNNAFDDQPITIIGLSSTLTDVLLIVKFSNDTTITRLIRPSNPKAWINYQNNTLFGDYFLIGFSHFLSGFDHILFVFVLMILIKNFKTLLKTITAFTVAHSITLALSTLNWVNLPQAPVEASIALSILFLAWRASLPSEIEQNRLNTPWISAFVFGLLHGFGFSTALVTLGLPEDNIVSALLLFNLGVEIAQILVIIPIYFGLVAISRLKAEIPHWLKRLPIYSIGTISCYWFLQRSILLLKSSF